MTFGPDGLLHVETPQILAMRAGLVFLGDNVVIFGANDSGLHYIAGRPRGPGMIAGFILRSTGLFDTVAPPPAIRAFIGVRAVTDQRGTAHVFWGITPDTTIDQFLHVRGIAYSQFDGTRWTTPQTIVNDSTMRWDVVLTGITALGDDIHLVIPTDENLIHIQRSASGRWNVKRLPIRALYATLAVLGHDTLLLASIHPAERGRRERTVISVQRSTDNGATWSTPAIVARAGLGGQFAVRLIPVPSALYAVWESSPPLEPPQGLQVGTPAERHDSIKASVSRDGGVTWRELAGLSVPRGAAGLVGGPGPDDAVHIAVELLSDSSLTIATATLKDDRWGRLKVLGPGPFWVALSAPINDSLFLAWDDWRVAGHDRAPMTQISTYGCATRRK